MQLCTVQYRFCHQCSFWVALANILAVIRFFTATLTISADATPANLHMNKYWELLPGNENLKEPKYTNLDYIKHLVPNVKIIVIFRDPVTRYVSYMIIMIGVK